MQRLQAQKLLRDRDGRRIITFLFQQASQLLRRPQKRLVPAIALRQDPLIIAARQQIAAIELHHPLQGRTACLRISDLLRLLRLDQGLFQLLHIQLKTILAQRRYPLHTAPLDRQKLLGMRQSLPQMIQQLAQIRMGLRFQ
ncbi:hypothetical protein KDK_53250 [Dictyobacter kobayashii]|uniref:Uncharacterized protein n=1 Tax=Dictyobacter kobayashii TaxID=2014872 RepID=A0A402AR02_9CHLR|nr:hypothetical protein KDK_53250 [Dictyobacter kobayashii]